MSKRQYKRYSKEFKLEAIHLADESDRPVPKNQVMTWTGTACCE